MDGYAALRTSDSPGSKDNLVSRPSTNSEQQGPNEFSGLCCPVTLGWRTLVSNSQGTIRQVGLGLA